MNVNGDMNVHPPTAAYRAMKVCLWDDFKLTALSDAALDVYENAVNYKKKEFLNQRTEHLKSI